MAKGGIQLDIGTKYDGEGFRKLDNELKNAGKSVKKIGRTVSRLTSEFQNLGGEAGQVAGKIGSIFGHFAQGGLVMGAVTLAVQGAVKGIDMLFEYLNKTNNAVKKVEESFKEGLAKAIGQTNEQIDKFSKKYNKVMGKMISSQALGQTKRTEEIKRMEYDRQDANTVVEGVGRAIVDVDYVKKIEAKKVQNAKSNVDELKNRIAWAQKEIDESKRYEEHHRNNQSIYREAASNAYSRGDIVAQAQFRNKVGYAKAEEAKWIKNTQNLQEQLNKLKIEELKAEQLYITQKRASDSAILQSEKKKSEAFRKIEEELQKQQAKKLEAEVKIKEQENQDAIKEYDNQIKELDASIENLTNAMSNMPNIIKNGVEPQQANPWNAPDKAQKKAEQEQKNQQNRADQIAGRIFDKNGNLRKSANGQEVDTLLNLVHNGAQLDDKQVKWLQARRDKLERLAGFTNRKMSDKDTKELAKLKDVLKGVDNQKKLRELEKERRDIQKKMAEDASQRTSDVREIRDKIKELGL